MKRNIPWLLVAFLLGLLIGQPAISSANSTQNAGYTFCVNKKTGALRQLLKGACTTKTENTLTMGAQGPQGLTGATGPAGSIGPQGVPGVGVEFRIVDASGTPIDRIVELDLDGVDPMNFNPWGGSLSFTRLVDGWLWHYTFDGAQPTSPWAIQIPVYYLDDSCSGPTYTGQEPSDLKPVATALQRLYFALAQYDTGGVNEYYRFVSTERLPLESSVEVWQLEGGSWVGDGSGNQWWEEPVCVSVGQNSHLWQVNRYTIPSNVFVETPVSIEWLN